MVGESCDIDQRQITTNLHSLRTCIGREVTLSTRQSIDRCEFLLASSQTKEPWQGIPQEQESKEEECEVAKPTEEECVKGFTL